MTDKIWTNLGNAFDLCNWKFDNQTVFVIISDICDALIKLEIEKSTFLSFDLTDIFIFSKNGEDKIGFLDISQMTVLNSKSFKSVVFCVVNLLRKTSPPKTQNKLANFEDSIYNLATNFCELKEIILGFLRDNSSVDQFMVRNRIFSWTKLPFFKTQQINFKKIEIEPILSGSIDVSVFLKHCHQIALDHSNKMQQFENTNAENLCQLNNTKYQKENNSPQKTANEKKRCDLF